jgi:uncharacterized protein
MKKACRLTALIGMGLALAPWVATAQKAAQAQAAKDSEGAVPVPVTVPAEQQPTRAQLDNLFEVMRVREQMASMTKMMPQLMQQGFTEQFKKVEKDRPDMEPVTEAQKQAVSKIMGRYMERVMNLYTADEMLDDMASLYQKHLSGSDVDAMIGFYSSPAGQHALNIVPVVMKEFMPMVMKKMQDRIQPAVDDMAKEMEAALKAPAGSGTGSN